jgi:hypothetical protein
MPVFAAAYRRLPRERVPQAATTLSALVQVGGSFGTAVLVLALTRRIADNFAAHGLASHGGGIGQLSGVPREQLARVAPLLAGGFGYAFWLALVLTAMALVPALFLLRQQLRESASGPGGPAGVVLPGRRPPDVPGYLIIIRRLALPSSTRQAPGTARFRRCSPCRSSRPGPR